MNKSKIPTIVGIIILIVGLALGVALLQYRQVFRLGAASGAMPKDVRVANISDSSLSISWLTENQTQGLVKWGNSESSLINTNLDEIGTQSFTHIVTLQNLTPNTSYFFKINSGGDDFDNSGSPWQIKTSSTPSPAGNLNVVSGSVVTPSGTPSKNSLVYVSASGILFSTLTSAAGTWVLPLPVNVDPARTLLEVSISAGPDGVSSTQIYPQSANPIPQMVLGQVYDFKNLPPAPAGGVTNASIGLSNEGTGSSRFNIPQGGGAQATTVTLDSTKTGEVVTTTKPEFFGTGPKGTKLSIKLESLVPVSASIAIPSSGEWKWSPPANLSPGAHTITLSWTDASGVVRTLTRSFVVQASEGPAFVSTPSATPTFKPSATPAPTIKPTATPTAPPTPATGSLTPTLLLFIMGLSTISFGILLWRES